MVWFRFCYRRRVRGMREMEIEIWIERNAAKLCRECQNYLEGEKREMVEIYERKGISPEDAVALVGPPPCGVCVFVRLRR